MNKLTVKCKTCGGERLVGVPHGERCMTTAEEYKNFIQARLAAFVIQHEVHTDGRIDVENLKLAKLL